MRVLNASLTPAAVLAVSGVLPCDRLSPRVGPAPELTVNGVTLRRANPPVLMATCAAKRAEVADLRRSFARGLEAGR